jgi:hypothetical protein
MEKRGDLGKSKISRLGRTISLGRDLGRTISPSSSSKQSIPLGDQRGKAWQGECIYIYVRIYVYMYT